MKKEILIYAIFLFCSLTVQAEGTKDLRPALADFGFLNPWDWGGEFATYDGPADQRLQVTIADHTSERIYIGFNAKANPAYFRVKRPDGTIISGPHEIPAFNGGRGYINTYDEAVAGPRKFNPAGYLAISVDPDVNGDYYIEINQGHPTIKAVPPAAGGFTYSLFDITVADTITNTIKEGRLWARLWALSTGNPNQLFNAELYVLRDDSIRFEIDYNGIDPFGFGIVSNSYGITNTGDFITDRKSQNVQTPPYVQGNVPYLPEHKIFLNPPDSDVFPFPNVIPTLDLPSSSSSLITGCILGGYCINIETSKAGQVEVKLDLDGVPGFQTGGRDRMVYGSVAPGNNCLSWDGFDALGDTAYSANIEIDYKYEAGLVHIPIYDAENHFAGYVFSLISAPDQRDTLKLYWDDSRFNSGVNGQNLEGCEVPCRNWFFNYGNERFLNTWSFAYDQNITLSDIQFSFCPPQVNNDTVQVNEGTPVIIKPVQNDLAPLNKFDLSSLQIHCGPFHGSATLLGNGELTYTPDFGYNGPDSICYVLCDTASVTTCDTAVIYIDVADVNLPPYADTVNGQPVQGGISGSLSTPEDQNLNICIQWGEYEGEEVSVHSLLNSSPHHGSVSNFADGDSCFTYIPDPDYFGPDTLLVEFCDDQASPACDTVFIPIQVTPVNDPPLAHTAGGIALVNDTAKTIVLNEDEPRRICITGTDVDPDELDVMQVLNAPLHGSVSGLGTGDSCFTYIPDLHYYGPDTLTLSFCDNGSPVLCDEVTIILNVLPVNDPPVALNDTLFLDPLETGHRKVKLNDFDVETDNSALVFSIVGGPFRGIASVVGDSIEYTPDASYTLGVDSVRYSLCDAGVPVECDTAVLLISVPKSQVPPFCENDTAITSEDVPVIIDFLANDFDPNLDPLSPGILTHPVNGTAVFQNNRMLYTPAANFFGRDSVQYYLCDNGTPPLCDTAWIDITVVSVPDGPEVWDDAGEPVDALVYNSNEDTPLAVCFKIVDPDGDQVRMTQVDGSTIGQISGVSDGDTCFTYTPDPDSNGVDTLEVTVCDDSSPQLCNVITLVVNIYPVNDPPVAKNDSATTNENTLVNVVPLLNDNDIADIGPLNLDSLKIVDGPYRGTLVILANGTIDYTPGTGFSGKDSIRYRICDEGIPLPALCTEAVIYIDVIPGNHPPTAVDDYTSTAVDQAIIADILSNDSDPDNDELTPLIVFGPLNGSASIINSAIQYVPDPGFCGLDTIVYQVCDDGSPVLCDTASVYISVFPADQDNDSLSDNYETLSRDTDKDGVPDHLDYDSDNDGISDLVEARPIVKDDPCSSVAYDFDGDGLPDYLDPDSDNDGIPDWAERSYWANVSTDIVKPLGEDKDEDGIDDAFDPDYGGSLQENPYDKDGDGWPDFRDLDSDGDGIPDDEEGGTNGGSPRDSDGDGIPDFRDLDSDGDGIPDDEEGGTNGGKPRDSDGDGIPDYLDTDSDNDGTPDDSESHTSDCDEDGIPDYRDEDSCAPSVPQGFSPNGDGVNDTFIIPGLDPALYPNNSLKVYNRWGNPVYSTSPYDNSWGGEPNVGGVFGSSDSYLPTGTYYYIFDLGDGTAPNTGWIFIKR